MLEYTFLSSSVRLPYLVISSHTLSCSLYSRIVRFRAPQLFSYTEDPAHRSYLSFQQTPLQFEIKGALPSDIHDTALSLHCARIAQELPPPLLSHYPLLNPRDIKLTSQHPIAAGGFADAWEATYDGRRVVLKSYRCYVSFDVTRTVTVCCGRLQQVRR